MCLDGRCSDVIDPRIREMLCEVRQLLNERERSKRDPAERSERERRSEGEPQ